MTILNRLLSPPQPQAAAFSPYAEAVLGGLSSGTGMTVTPETALKISTVWACVGLIADCVGMLPTLMYRYLGDGGRERAKSHPLYDVLRDQPNARQTAFEFKQMLTSHLLMRGNAYAKIQSGPRGFADQLVPVHPDAVTINRKAGGVVTYTIGTKEYNDGDILHLRGLSSDGVEGLSVVSYARESFGLALAGERAGAKTFGNGSRPSGVLKTTGTLSPDAAKRVKKSWQDAQGGVENTGKVAVLEQGLEWQTISLNNKDTQWIESREFQAEDICRWFRVPPHMVGLTSKATSWGSGIEQMGIGFVTYTLMPWLTIWEQGITRDLILAPQTYFVEFLTDALLKGDLKSRYDAYAIGRSWGWLSANDVRQRENQNPISNGDIYLQPSNMIEAGSQIAQTVAPTGNAHYQQLLHETAARIVRKEIAAISKINSKHADAPDDWRAAVNEFYSTHADFVATTLRIDPVLAQEYVREQLGQLATDTTLEGWESRCVERLKGLVLRP